MTGVKPQEKQWAEQVEKPDRDGNLYNISSDECFVFPDVLFYNLSLNKGILRLMCQNIIMILAHTQGGDCKVEELHPWVRYLEMERVGCKREPTRFINNRNEC